MRILLLVLATLFMQDVIPFKAKEEFELKLDLQFKTRPTAAQNVAYPTEQRSATPLPYLMMELTVLKVLEDETKVKVINNETKVIQVLNLEKKQSMILDLGFTDDLKDGVSSHKYDVNFYSDDKKLKRTIAIEFDHDGYYFVNGEKRGRI